MSSPYTAAELAQLDEVAARRLRDEEFAKAQPEYEAKRLDILRHSLGLTRAGARPYRNHFVTGPGSDDYEVCESLVADGLMVKRAGNALTGGDPCYLVTEAGRAKATGAA